MRRYRRDRGIFDRSRRYSRDIPSGPYRADCTSAVHFDHVSRLRSSAEGWHGRNTYWYDPIWYIGDRLAASFTALQVIKFSGELCGLEHVLRCRVVSWSPRTHLRHASSSLRSSVFTTTTHVVGAAMPTHRPSPANAAPPSPPFHTVFFLRTQRVAGLCGQTASHSTASPSSFLGVYLFPCVR